MGYKYHRVQKDWHRLDTPRGTYFGRTRGEVFKKAKLDEVRALTAVAQEQQQLALDQNQS